MATPKAPVRKIPPGNKDKGDKCTKCTKPAGEKEEGVQCEICQLWSHAKCVDVSTELYCYLQKCANIHWYCDSCNKGVGQVLEEWSKLSNRQENTELKVNELKDDVKQLYQKIEKLEEKQNESKLSNEQTLAEVVKKAERDIEKQVETKTGSVAADVVSLNRAIDSAKSLAAEEQEKENR